MWAGLNATTDGSVVVAAGSYAETQVSQWLDLKPGLDISITGDSSSTTTIDFSSAPAQSALLLGSSALDVNVTVSGLTLFGADISPIRGPGVTQCIAVQGYQITISDVVIDSCSVPAGSFGEFEAGDGGIAADDVSVVNSGGSFGLVFETATGYNTLSDITVRDSVVDEGYAVEVTGSVGTNTLSGFTAEGVDGGILHITPGSDSSVDSVLVTDCAVASTALPSAPILIGGSGGSGPAASTTLTNALVFGNTYPGFAVIEGGSDGMSLVIETSSIRSNEASTALSIVPHANIAVPTTVELAVGTAVYDNSAAGVNVTGEIAADDTVRVHSNSGGNVICDSGATNCLACTECNGEDSLGGGTGAGTCGFTEWQPTGITANGCVCADGVTGDACDTCPDDETLLPSYDGGRCDDEGPAGLTSPASFSVVLLTVLLVLAAGM